VALECYCYHLLSTVTVVLDIMYLYVYMELYLISFKVFGTELEP